MKEAIVYANCMMELTGLLPYQLLGVDVGNNPRLRLIDTISDLSYQEVIGFDKLLRNATDQKNRKKMLFSSLSWTEAYVLISRMYHKSIKVNLNDDTFEPIEVYGKEWKGEQDVNEQHARELMPHLGYERWENFDKAILRAMESCLVGGIEVTDHFREVTKMAAKVGKLPELRETE